MIQDMLALDFMRQALVAALLAGVAAPLVGVFLVQRRMSLIGDGMGHVALAGVAVGILTGTVLVTTLVLRQRFFAVANDEEFSRATGLPVMGYNLALAVLTAVTVVVSMRVVGLLLISALMIIPNATSQLLARSFRASLWLAVLIGVVSSVGGVVISYVAETPSGGTIVLVAISLFLLTSVGVALLARARHASHARAQERHDHEHGPGCGHPAVGHGDHVDYLHDGHRHAAHEGHYDEHGQHAEVESR